MICPTCRGSGKRTVKKLLVSNVQVIYTTAEVAPNEPVLLSEAPCPECHGFGIIHCCEGEQAQPEPKEKE